ncbi:MULTISPECIES: 3-hydroxyacyl-CoA dehydrogenase [Halocynthiibacter]|uniref:3-hydroxyacyl-CoA dehydrogenase n=1 Tax=Halocynthiibacter halioticoli TaxID=2986804 RepID=A0AAE3IWX1_9RHOB|nr:MULTISPECIES: 3-hydroxyacyl-CoA dehydrogenase [Halocynthiibacter]MCV6823494.1 3-hydroxyacyl-CoA dehydrogenase [Halocynthiibacter halioticoli]MCW4056495.1 3-hydroxyacyl-CoA dehydrogenase [Halocynthiibacter sp. SDUM655004]
MTGVVAIIGAGIVGRSWAICFARAGISVRLFDAASGVAEAAISEIAQQLVGLEEKGLLGSRSQSEILEAIVSTEALAEAVAPADYIQENGPERLAVKQALTQEIDALARSGVPIASSTSAILPSEIARNTAGKSRCLVAHPLNPPHLIPAVEIVPSTDTDAEIVQQVAALMQSIGQTPVVARHEAEGFIMNRLQGALLDEAVKLVAEGIADPADVDRAMSAGLSRRWSFMGPFETIDLNAPGGIAEFFDRYGEAYRAIGRERPARYDWNGPVAEQLVASRRNELPAKDLQDRQNWRDDRLAELAAFWTNKGTEIHG